MRAFVLGLTGLALASCGGRAPMRQMVSPVRLQGAPSAEVSAGENYEALPPNGFVETSADALATFSLDVDTGSYALMRRDILRGSLPHPDGVEDGDARLVPVRNRHRMVECVMRDLGQVHRTENVVNLWHSSPPTLIISATWRT